VAALALASPKSVFRCAIAVAPVTNWKLYGKMFDVLLIFARGEKTTR
jgi:dipeptidyl aminopeptidase/acylaminoacyl peptidase